MSTSVTSGGSIWLEVEYAGITGRGKVASALVVSLRLRTPSEAIEVVAHRAPISLSFAGEHLAATELAPVEVSHFGITTEAVFTLSPRAWAFIGAHGTGSDLAFELDVRGLLRVRRTGDPPRLMRSNVPQDTWTDVISEPVRIPFTVPRSTWFAQVMSRIGDATYTSVEIEIPRLAGDAFAASIARLADAEAAYAMGDDAAVFSHCKGAVDAVPGFPAAAFALIPNERKRGALDGLLRAAGGYLHTGRHVSRESSDAGDFPVDHRDALFALNLTRLFLAYISTTRLGPLT